MTMNRVLNVMVLAICLLLIQCTLSLFERQTIDKEIWPKTIYKEISFPVQSRIECTALCSLETDACLASAWDGFMCYLADTRSQFSVAPTSHTKDIDMFIRQDAISSAFAEYFHLVDPIVNHWNAKIYLSVPKGSLFACHLECQWNLSCQLFTIKDGICHLGNGTINEHKAPQIANPPGGVYVHPGFVLEAGPLIGGTWLSGNNLVWENYIYYSNTCDQRERCELWCLLDGIPCQFLGYGGSTCFLGSTGQKSGLIDGLHLGLPLGTSFWISKNGIENTDYEDVFDTSFLSSNYASFIVSSRSAENVQQGCQFICALLTNPVCHFVSLSNGICHFGNMDNSSGSSSSTDAQMVLGFLPELNTTMGSYFSIPTHHHIWRMRMHTLLTLNSTIGACSIRCQLMDLPKPCKLFVYDGLVCHLGALNHYESVDSTDDIFNLHIHESELPYLSSFYKPRVTTDWASQMYKKILLTHSSPKSEDECLLRCNFDDGPCYSFVVQGKDCYLGDPFVNSSLYIETWEAVLMETNPKLHLTHGGQDSQNDVNTSSIFKGYAGVCDHGLLDLPVPLRSMGYAYGDESVFVCGGTSDTEGEEQDKCYQWRFDTFPRAWVTLPAMIDSLVMFPMFYQDGTLYAAGGLSSGSNIIPNMRMLTLSSSSSWTHGAAYSDSGFYAHCGILHQSRIFTFGGSRNMVTYSKSVQIYEISSDLWFESSFVLPKGLRQMACGLVPGNGGWISDLFLLAGGETGPSEYSSTVYSIDPASNGVVKKLFQLPMTISRFGSQNSFAAFQEHVVFLTIGFGNGIHVNNAVFVWNRWDIAFYEYNTPTNGREQPGNAIIPLRHIPVCGDQSKMWKLILNHENPTRFSIGGWNDDFEFAKSSYFNRLDEYRCDGGRYHFRLVYPELGTYNEWYQTNDPSNPEHFVITDYLGVALGLPRGFNGLVYNNRDALMMGDSNTTHPQWFSVGRIKMDSSDGRFPGPPNCFVSKLQLFIRDDCATT